MSTYVYLMCLDHDPPLRATNESGQHLYDLPRIRREVQNREALVAAYRDGALNYHRASVADIDDYFALHSAEFLAQHESCRIGIEDERGQEHSLGEASDE